MAPQTEQGGIDAGFDMLMVCFVGCHGEMHWKLPSNSPRVWLCYGVLGSHALTDDLSENEQGETGNRSVENDCLKCLQGV